MHEPEREQVIAKRRILLTGSGASMFLLGLIYAFSMFSAPMSEAFGLEPSAVALTFNIAMVATALGTLFGSALDMKFGLRFALIATGTLSFVGFAGTSLLGHSNIMALYVFYGGIAGLAAGMGNNLVVATTNLWFPDKVGFSSGVMMMCFSFSALLLGNAALALMGTVGLEAVFTGIGTVTLIVVCALAFVLERPPAHIAELLHVQTLAEAGNDAAEGHIALKSPVFYVYWCWAAIVFAIGMATIGNCASDARLVGIDAGTATLLVGCVSAGNGIARLAIGLLYDRTDIKVTMLADTLVAVLACTCIAASFATGSHLAFVVGALCCGFCYGGVPVVAAAFARKRFGRALYPLNLSLANLAMIYGSVANIAIQAGVAGNRGLAFTVLTALALVAVVVVAAFSRIWNRDMAQEERSTETQAVRAE